MICHYTPLLSEPDTSLADGDIIKLYLGAHIDGFIAVVAHTWVLGDTAEVPVNKRKAEASEATLPSILPSFDHPLTLGQG